MYDRMKVKDVVLMGIFYFPKRKKKQGGVKEIYYIGEGTSETVASAW